MKYLVLSLNILLVSCGTVGHDVTESWEVIGTYDYGTEIYCVEQDVTTYIYEMNDGMWASDYVKGYRLDIDNAAEAGCKAIGKSPELKEKNQ